MLEYSIALSTLPFERCGCIRINHPRALACTSEDSSPCDYRVVLHTPTGTLSLTLEDNVRESFTSEVVCLALSPESQCRCSDRVPRYVCPTITGKKPWSTPFDSQQTFLALHVSVGSSAGRPSTSHRETRGGGVCDEHKSAGWQADACKLLKSLQRRETTRDSVARTGPRCLRCHSRC